MELKEDTIISQKEIPIVFGPSSNRFLRHPPKLISTTSSHGQMHFVLIAIDLLKINTQEFSKAP